MFWLGLGMMAVGVAMAVFGQRGDRNAMSVHGSSGTFIQGVKGDVNIGGGAPGAAAKPSSEERFLKWGGFAIALAGLAIAAAKLFMG